MQMYFFFIVLNKQPFDKSIWQLQISDRDYKNRLSDIFCMTFYFLCLIGCLILSRIVDNLILKRLIG